MIITSYSSAQLAKRRHISSTPIISKSSFTRTNFKAPYDQWFYADTRTPIAFLAVDGTEYIIADGDTLSKIDNIPFTLHNLPITTNDYPSIVYAVNTRTNLAYIVIAKDQQALRSKLESEHD